MTRKLIIGLMSLTMSVSGLTGAYCWFRKAETTAASCVTTNEKEDAAARHARNQPRHWRFLMLQQK